MFVSIPKWCDSKDNYEYKLQNTYVLFQFQSGAIQSDNMTVKGNCIVWFQFQSGAIQSCASVSASSRAGSSFNSKVVRFKAKQERKPGADFGCFNSKVVRFKVCAALFPAALIVLFQFQSGAIQRFFSDCFYCFFVQFQFQSGAIQSNTALTVNVPDLCFNSKVVRFKAFCLIYALVIVVVSIPKWCDSKQFPEITETAFTSFNSKVVRFKGRNTGGGSLETFVSIPKWCDSKPTSQQTQDFIKSFNSKVVRFKDWRIFLFNLFFCVSIPKWCDSKDRYIGNRLYQRQFQFQSGAIQRSL